jgi:transcriptional regulator with XRE-family HTH domain
MIGQLLRERRESLGLSQTDVARRAGSSQRQVSRLENNEEAMPRRDTLERFGAVLGITLAEFYRAAGVMPSLVEEAPRVVVIRGPNGEQEVPIARVVAYVEGFPNERHQARLERWRATHDAETYARLCARVFVAWSSNYELMLDALDVAELR